jgi:hypothetical protein
MSQNNGSKFYPVWQMLIWIPVLLFTEVWIISANEDCSSRLNNANDLNYILYSSETDKVSGDDSREISIFLSDLYGVNCRLDLYVDTSRFTSSGWAPHLPSFKVSGTYPTWSPNGDTIAFIGEIAVNSQFTASLYKTYPGIYHRDPIGYFYSAGNTRRLYLGNDNQPYLGPLQWHPSRDYLAFWHMNMKDGERPTFSYNIIEAETDDLPVSWGPNYTGMGMIAWSPTDDLWVEAFPSPPNFLFRVNRINTWPSQTIITDLFQKRNPTWTPDGTTIGFAYNREDSFDIFTILPDGTGLERVTSHGDTHEDYPSWSPFGDWLAYLQSDVESVEPTYDFAFRQWPDGETYIVTPPSSIWPHYKWLPDNSGVLFYMRVDDEHYALHWLEIGCATSESGCVAEDFNLIPNTETYEYYGFDVTDNMNLRFEGENE